MSSPGGDLGCTAFKNSTAASAVSRLLHTDAANSGQTLNWHPLETLGMGAKPRLTGGMAPGPGGDW
jgi:hypothetical protein